jgi:hypothetical protein
MENGLRADLGRRFPGHLFLSFASEDYIKHLVRKSEKVPPI